MNNFDNKKQLFMNYCMVEDTKFNKYLPHIKNGMKLEAVLIEFRLLPHISFLLKNAIYRLGNEWSFTIICGQNNYDFIVNIVRNIRRDIRIIKKNVTNITREEYSIMLLNSNFWKQFKGEKILIYQEDTIILKKLNPKFLKYDYIGAPFYNKDIGNGGLSLRTKDIMIKVCKEYFDSYIKDMERNVLILKKYKDRLKMKYGNNFLRDKRFIFFYKIEESILEDLQITNRLKKYNIGLLPDFNTATEFSIEKYYNDNAFGGHQFWYSVDNLIPWLRKKLNN